MTDYLPQNPRPDVLADAIAHTRNKNLTIDIGRPTLALRAVRKVQGWCAALERKLLPRSSARMAVTEQVLENALLLGNIGSARDILDFGGFESTLPIALSALGHRITVLDQRAYPFVSDTLVTLRADILQPLTDLTDRFDLVYSISTIEHVGLGGYGSPIREGGDRIALDHLWATLRSGGRLLFTVPAGRPTIRRGYRVYDEVALRGILPGPGRVEFFLKPGRFASWRPASAEEIARHTYSQYDTVTPVEGLAFVVVEKP